MLRRILDRRTLVTAAVAVVAATGSVAGVSLAQGNGGPAAPATSTQGPAQPGNMLGGVHDALSELVAAGTIDQQQADAVQAQADAGSIDPKVLTETGVVTDAQMHAIADRLDALKRSAGQ